MPTSDSDALVVYGATGDLAHKMIFPALYAMVKHGTLKVPVIGVAFPKWSLERLHRRVTHSIKQAGGIDNKQAFRHLLSLAPICERRLQRQQHLRGDQAGAWESASPRTLSGHPAVAFCHRNQGAGRVRAGRECAGDCREALWPRSCLGSCVESRRDGRCFLKIQSSASITSWARRRS